MSCCSDSEKKDFREETAGGRERDEISAAQGWSFVKRLVYPSTIFILLVKFYRKFISPLKPACCRFEPTCSQYAIDAVQKHGFIKGFYLAVYRVFRCQPFSEGGYDPVPEVKTVSKIKYKEENK